MNATIASVILLGVCLALAVTGWAVGNVAVMVAGLPCAFACVVIVLWAEIQEGREP